MSLTPDVFAALVHPTPELERLAPMTGLASMIGYLTIARNGKEPLGREALTLELGTAAVRSHMVNSTSPLITVRTWRLDESRPLVIGTPSRVTGVGRSVP